MHISSAKKRLNTKMPWLCDSIDNALKHALGDRPNSEFIIGPDCKILISRQWSDPEQLREDLEDLVGKPDQKSSPRDFDHRSDGAKPEFKRGVVKRVPVPEGSRPVKVTHVVNEETNTPVYIKLRAEADSDLLKDGSGKLHLGFHIDPIHQVHWNNLAAPLAVKISASGDASLNPKNLIATKVEEVESDVDPREFLVIVSDLARNDKLTLTAKFFACHDVEGWCKPVTQTFEVSLMEDRDAGRPRRLGSNRGRRGGGAARGRGGPPSGQPFSLERLFERDANDDGKLTRDELPQRMRQRFERMDTNGDGFVERSEMEERFRRSRGGRASNIDHPQRPSEGEPAISSEDSTEE